MVLLRDKSKALDKMIHLCKKLQIEKNAMIARVGYINLNKVIVPCDIPMAKESMHSDGKTIGGPHWRGRASKKGLALT